MTKDNVMSARETQFAGFAKALLEELLSQRDGALDYSEWWQRQAEAIIARRAYDLVRHAAGDITSQAAHVDAVSDLAELPGESEGKR